SRRRHTRCYRDWSSDVCSSDLFYYAVSHGRISAWHTVASLRVLAQRAREKTAQLERLLSAIRPDVAVIDSEYTVGPLRQRAIPRSEERRVGKEERSR